MPRLAFRAAVAISPGVLAGIGNLGTFRSPSTRQPSINNAEVWLKFEVT